MTGRLRAFRGPIMVHKHRGNRWTVRTDRDEDGEVFDWLTEHFGEEDFENGPWACMGSQEYREYARYDITSETIVTMMLLRWS